MIAQPGLPIPSPKDRIFAPGIIFTDIAEGLIKKGHEVKIFAANDSTYRKDITEGFGLDSSYSSDQKLSDSDKNDRTSQHCLLFLKKAIDLCKKEDFDVVYIDYHPQTMYLAKLIGKPVFSIHHGVPANDSDLKLDIDRFRQKEYFSDVNFISISENQRNLGKEYYNYVTTIHHGVDLNKFVFNPNPAKDLLFMGRVEKKKGPDVAAKVAKQSGRKLEIYGQASSDGEFWIKDMEPLIDNENIQYKGHIEFEKVSEIYGNAKAILVPISWEEPFGLVVIEAMACGTPVVAFNRGSMSELIVDGKTGFLVEHGNVEEMVQAVLKIDQIDRNACREHVEKNFSLERMIQKYEDLFKNFN